MSPLAKQISVPIFSGQNYDYWAIKMKTYFQSRKLWEIVEEEVTLPEDSSTSSSVEKGKLENKKAKDSEALYYIQTAVADHIFPRISVATSAKEAWSILQKEYQGSANVHIIKLQTLRRDFENMKMTDSETIDEYYTKVRELVNQLKAYGEDIPEKRVVEKLLISVTEKYDTIVTTIEETKDITTLTVTELVGSLEAYEKRRIRREENSLENAFQSKLNMRSQNSNRKEENFKSTMGDKKKQNKGKYIPCRICKRTNHLEKDCYFWGKPQCRNCKRFGHVEKDCRFKGNHQANCIEENNSSDQLFYTCNSVAETGEATWYIDSAASNHMTYNKGAFQTLDESFKTNVKLGDNHIVKVEEKDQSLSTQKKVFKKFKNLVEKQSGQSIKVLRSDRGKEYNNSKFDKFCEEEGIKHQTSVSYNPQQNGVSERKNRTVMEMARSMLQEKHLPKAFWAEAVYTAVYLLNRCPTKAVQNMTPIEAWSGKKPSAKHLRVFGSICYVHIPTEKRHKLEEKTEKGIFLGYSTQSKGYRIYNLKTKKLIISRDVEFDEDAMWNWDEEKVERQSVMIPKETLRNNNKKKEQTKQKWKGGVNKHQDHPEGHHHQKRLRKKPRQEGQSFSVIYTKHATSSYGSIQKHKARLVAKGYSQLPGIDYTETFAPVARLDTIRALIAIAANKKWKIYQMGVKSAFLNGYIDEEIYVEQPQGFIAKGSEEKVLRLKKALYGLKQAYGWQFQPGPEKFAPDPPRMGRVWDVIFRVRGKFF
ncbi:UNVERIFIED_CONTAM: putative mitochondrial protein [Sesamum radiatum]|uniref:Mitochondrial protein n=1 Tax=Sesamum radiatum TaxID=300843 RepID=A0AAW2MWB1_SESRA